MTSIKDVLDENSNIINTETAPTFPSGQLDPLNLKNTMEQIQNSLLKNKQVSSQSSNNKFNIICKIDDIDVILLVEQNYTIDYLYKLLKFKVGNDLPQGSICFVYNGLEIKRGMKLYQLGVHDKSVIYIMSKGHIMGG